MNNPNPTPKRKYPRLKGHDYSQEGSYFITICTHERLPTLSSIVEVEGVGASPHPTSIGEIIENELIALPNRFPSISIDNYVIMPNHIHVLITIFEGSDSSIMDIVRAFKSVSARICNQTDNTPARKIWQRSFYDTIIRNERAYKNFWDYIESNPSKWHNDEYYM
ncbi:MAG: transposase [Defluviitaleaceae bacterium]|nr:transposase [Defluviitaleaceae bacterium]